jgi:sortase (surface protein transpeptidase)
VDPEPTIPQDPQPRRINANAVNVLDDWVIRRHRASRGSGGSRVGAIVLGLAGLAAAGMGGAALLGMPMPAHAATSGVWLAPKVVPSADPSHLAGPPPPTIPVTKATGPLIGSPTWLKIPEISVSTSLESLHLDAAGALNPPSSFNDAGWYANGTPPGDIGPAVIAGHIDSTKGPAIFYRLANLKPGDQVQVLRGLQWVVFTVTEVERYPKTKFPTGTVYGPTPTPELRLITCGGTFDSTRGSYDDNIVVYAKGAG